MRGFWNSLLVLAITEHATGQLASLSVFADSSSLVHVEPDFDPSTMNYDAFMSSISESFMIQASLEPDCEFGAVHSCDITRSGSNCEPKREQRIAILDFSRPVPVPRDSTVKFVFEVLCIDGSSTYSVLVRRLSSQSTEILLPSLLAENGGSGTASSKSTGLSLGLTLGSSGLMIGSPGLMIGSSGMNKTSPKRKGSAKEPAKVKLEVPIQTFMVPLPVLLTDPAQRVVSTGCVIKQRANSKSEDNDEGEGDDEDDNEDDEDDEDDDDNAGDENQNQNFRGQDDDETLSPDDDSYIETRWVGFDSASRGTEVLSRLVTFSYQVSVGSSCVASLTVTAPNKKVHTTFQLELSRPACAEGLFYDRELQACVRHCDAGQFASKGSGLCLSCGLGCARCESASKCDACSRAPLMFGLLQYSLTKDKDRGDTHAITPGSLIVTSSGSPEGVFMASSCKLLVFGRFDTFGSIFKWGSILAWVFLLATSYLVMSKIVGPHIVKHLPQNLFVKFVVKVFSVTYKEPTSSGVPSLILTNSEGTVPLVNKRSDVIDIQ